MPGSIKKIGIIGDGGWGTTLAIHLSKKKYQVTLWGAFSDYVEQVKELRFNQKFLPGIRIPSEVNIVSGLSEAITPNEIIVLAVPSKFINEILKKIKKFDLKSKIFLSVIKGIDPKNLLRMSQIIEKELGHIQLAVLSGPTIAMEVAKEIPSSAVIASKDKKTARLLQKIINSENFRIYTNTDVVGVELGGSIKNIIAIACGVCDGLGFGTNTKAAIMTRGLAEMARLGKALGARGETFFGLTGLGDLVTTCVNPDSRNRTVGEHLGKGLPIAGIISSMSMVAEGVETSMAVNRLSQKFKVSMPITREVYNIIYKHKSPIKAVSDLMNRKIKSE